jgi:hypothetical protein
MQNRYVGDIGDFAKYGLLRAVLREAKFRLGVMWYCVPDESHNNDGRHSKYVAPTEQNHQKFRRCDPILYDALGELVAEGQRNLSAIRDSNILRNRQFLQ